MTDYLVINDCFDKQHIIKIEDILDFSTYQAFKNPPVTTIKLKEVLSNGYNKNYKTYETEDSIRLRYSVIYNKLHGL